MGFNYKDIFEDQTFIYVILFITDSQCPAKTNNKGITRVAKSFIQVGNKEIG